MNLDEIFLNLQHVPGELFWSTGLNKEITLCVKKASWPGKNRMRKLLSTIREEIQDSQKKKASTRLTTHNSQIQDHVYNSESDYVYLGFYVAFNTVQVISRWVVGRAEETSTYSSLGFCTANCRPTASNYQLSHLRP